MELIKFAISNMIDIYPQSDKYRVSIVDASKLAKLIFGPEINERIYFSLRKKPLYDSSVWILKKNAPKLLRDFRGFTK